MSSKTRRPLAIFVSVALGLATLAPLVHADPQPQSQREERARRRAAGKQAEQAKPALYPNATRKSPETNASPKAIKHLQELSAMFDKEQWAELIVKAEEVAAMEKANAYDKSFAYMMAGSAAANMDDQAKAEHYFQMAVDTNGLDNDSHYSAMYNLVAVRYGEEKYAEALAMLDRFLLETKTEKPDQLSLRAGILAAMNRRHRADRPSQLSLKLPVAWDSKCSKWCAHGRCRVANIRNRIARGSRSPRRSGRWRGDLALGDEPR